MQIPPPFTPLSIARDKYLIHTPSIHSSLTLSVYCLPLYTKFVLWLRHLCCYSESWKFSGYLSWSCAGLSGVAGWKEQENESWKWKGAIVEGKEGDYSQCLSQSERRLQWQEGGRESRLVFWAGWSTQGRRWLQLHIRPGPLMVSHLPV